MHQAYNVIRRSLLVTVYGAEMKQKQFFIKLSVHLFDLIISLFGILSKTNYFFFPLQYSYALFTYVSIFQLIKI